MPFVDLKNLPASFIIQNKLGKESQQAEHPEYGIYQQRYKRLDFWRKGYTPKGKRKNFKMKFYRPTNPRTPEQQANRAKFAQAVQAWQNLPLDQKRVYNEKASKKPMSGYNLFIKKFF